ncbi:hypothetical protein SAMN03080601_00337 [Alkalitalea saponilacus]|uniref:Lipoprotein n=1 Tax=Alkalitalea saponilacus TaxID=889453 RepID=A0A1T5AQ93_9BACT|nr:hypothetical protein SAMN03080601_00337 [Alkalitalea saponilacus]
MIHAKTFLKVNNLKIISLLTAFLSIGCNNKVVFYSDDSQDVKYQVVDVDSLEMKALDYDNKPIEISGYFHMDIENIYIHNNNNENRIWLDFNFFKPLKGDNDDTLNGKRLMTLKGKKVKVRGVYKIDKTGHLGVYNGGITDITLFGSN